MTGGVEVLGQKVALWSMGRLGAALFLCCKSQAGGSNIARDIIPDVLDSVEHFSIVMTFACRKALRCV